MLPRLWTLLQDGEGKQSTLVLETHCGLIVEMYCIYCEEMFAVEMIRITIICGKFSNIRLHAAMEEHCYNIIICVLLSFFPPFVAFHSNSLSSVLLLLSPVLLFFVSNPVIPSPFLYPLTLSPWLFFLFSFLSLYPPMYSMSVSNQSYRYIRLHLCSCWGLQLAL